MWRGSENLTCIELEPSAIHGNIADTNGINVGDAGID